MLIMLIPFSWIPEVVFVMLMLNVLPITFGEPSDFWHFEDSISFIAL